MSDVRVLEYLDPQARSPFAAWFEGLNAVASAQVAAALYQLAVGNWLNVKGVGPACSNGRLMLDQDIGFISARTVIAS
ncbi:MAG: hypothetical protein L0Z46_12765 [Nitrospiraceae bacterium]|nr:hypothetical protein [Nitrospiraceae bacterium]